jgi:two-component system chemotaxis response regulator CheB
VPTAVGWIGYPSPIVPASTSTEAAIPSYVVIGTSAGGVNALTQIFKNLPAEFLGAVLVVQHVATGWSSQRLAEVLTRAGQLSAKVAEDGEPIRQGVAYVAPAGTHLLVGVGGGGGGVCASVRARASSTRGPPSMHSFAAPRPPSGRGSSA